MSVSRSRELEEGDRFLLNGNEPIAKLTIDHWQVEALHYIRDTTFAGDASQLRPAAHPASWQPGATSPSEPREQLARNIAASLHCNARGPPSPLDCKPDASRLRRSPESVMLARLPDSIRSESVVQCKVAG